MTDLQYGHLSQQHLSYFLYTPALCDQTTVELANAIGTTLYQGCLILYQGCVILYQGCLILYQGCLLRLVPLPNGDRGIRIAISRVLSMVRSGFS